MMRRNYTFRERLVLKVREIKADLKNFSECSFQCPGCKSGNTSGEYPRSWICHNCGAGGSQG